MKLAKLLPLKKRPITFSNRLPMVVALCSNKPWNTMSSLSVHSAPDKKIN